MDFKGKLNDFISGARDAATAADTLDNKNLRDILLLGVARFEQALQHPDVDRVGQSDEQRNMPFHDDAELNSGGNALFAAGDPGRALQNEEAQRRAAFEQPAGVGQAGAPVATPLPAGQQFNAGAEPFPGSVDDTAKNYAPHPQQTPPVDEPNKPGPLDGKSMDPNAQGRSQSDAPGQSHGDPGGEKSSG